MGMYSFQDFELQERNQEIYDLLMRYHRLVRKMLIKSNSKVGKFDIDSLGDDLELHKIYQECKEIIGE